MERPLIGIGSLGGTIAMAPGDSGGVKPTLSAEDLIAAVPQLDEIARITARSLANLASPSLTFTELKVALDFAREMVDEGAAGVVLTHGTDTLEESAYFFDLFWDRPEPLILTGAMRSSRMLGADGPANLHAATIVATDERVRGYGVLVVIDDEVHLARHVTKAHANAVWTFTSRDWGPVGRIFESKLRLGMAPAHIDEPLALPEDLSISIPVIEAGLDTSRAHVDALVASGITGLVIAGAGVGHVPAPVIEACSDALEAGVPVVFATRAGSGSTGTCSYDYPGAEMDALRRGIIMAGYLSPRKARILLWALEGSDMDTIRAEFLLRGD